MDAPIAAIPEWLDLTAIATGAGTATLVAANMREKRLDWLGIAMIGVAVGLGGGMIRDVLIGIRPAAMTTNSYLLTAVIAALVGMFLQRVMSFRGARHLTSLLDAAALGVFCAVGTLKATNYELDLLPAVLLGTITAAGGGVVRDLLVGMPVGIMYAGSLYAIAAVAGAFAFIGADAVGLDAGWSVAICIAVTFAVRMSSVWWGLSLPEQMSLSLRLPKRRRANERDGELTDEGFLRASGFHAPRTSGIPVVPPESPEPGERREPPSSPAPPA